MHLRGGAGGGGGEEGRQKHLAAHEGSPAFLVRGSFLVRASEMGLCPGGRGTALSSGLRIAWILPVATGELGR